MPAREYDSQLRAVLSYYESVVNVTPEGDSSVSEETLEGLGTGSSSYYSLVYSLFGSLLRAGFPAPQATSPPLSPSPSPQPSSPTISEAADERVQVLPKQIQDMDVAEATAETVVDAAARRRPAVADGNAKQSGDGTPQERLGESHSGAKAARKKKFVLTDYVPDPGYFLAGAIAGGVSRTATAPLDRLKVYLLVNTRSSTETAAAAFKQGRPIAAVQNSVRPIKDAVRELFLSGGLRGFFAGKAPLFSRHFVCAKVSPELTLP